MIQLTTKDVHGSTTEAMKEVLSSKFAYLEKIADPESVKITIAREGERFKAIALFSMKNKPIKVESGAEDDAYLAADLLANKAKEVVQDARNRLKRNGRQKSRTHHESLDLFGVVSDEPTNRIVRRKKFNTKPMDEESAIGEMEALGHETFIFINSELEGKICMLYTRKAGGYGLIELE